LLLATSGGTEEDSDLTLLYKMMIFLLNFVIIDQPDPSNDSENVPDPQEISQDNTEEADQEKSQEKVEDPQPGKIFYIS